MSCDHAISLGYADALVSAHNLYLARNEGHDVVIACVGNTLDFNYFDQQVKTCV